MSWSEKLAELVAAGVDPLAFTETVTFERFDDGRLHLPGCWATYNRGVPESNTLLTAARQTLDFRKAPG